MKRVGACLLIGWIGLSLIYLFTSRAKQDRPLPAIPNHPVDRERLNINTAAAHELESLPGLGPVAVQRIIEYRERHGRFHQPSDLLIIEGIGEKKYRALANLIRVE